MAPEVTFDFIKTFPGRLPIEVHVQYSVDVSTVLILFGPSGSGKTTILRSLAGLESPESGRIQFLSKTWLDTKAGVSVSPQDRRIGYMPQDYALFPTYSVAGNIEYGLGALASPARNKRVAEMLELFQLQGLAKMKPRELSGGQQQRVALARAVAPRPLLLLLDEPLSALDGPTRLQLRGELKHLLKQLALPSIIVTHDWAEALTLGNMMAVLGEGRTHQVGKPQDVFSRPMNATVARIVGVETVVQGKVLESVQGLTTVVVNETRLKGLGSAAVGSLVYVCIRAEDVVLELAGLGLSSARNHLMGQVRMITPHGVTVQVTIDCGFLLTATITRGALEDLGLVLGAPVRAAIKAGGVHLVLRSAE